VNERDQFLAEIKNSLRPILKAEGFRASGNTTFRRKLGDVIHVLTIQGSRHGGQCCVCLGIHLMFLPLVGTGGICDPEKITEPECEFRSRLRPEGMSDFWWKYGSSEEEARLSAASLLHIYQDVGRPYLQKFSKFPEDFCQLTPSMLANGITEPFPRNTTAARRALALSRIYIHLGRIDEAKQFAEFGLAHVGPAIALKSEMQNIIQMQK
jgi:hypothetical protein